MNDIDAIKDIEALKQLKARYCRLLDTKDWAGWRGIFTSDFISDTSESGGKVIADIDEFIAFVRKSLSDRTTVHQVHAPEIELTSETTARGIWALEDLIRFAPGLNMRGYGHYHESYEKSDGQWRIKSSKLTRLRVDIVTPILSVYVSDWLKQRLIKSSQRRTD
jgi:SnoaL-like domain